MGGFPAVSGHRHSTIADGGGLRTAHGLGTGKAYLAAKAHVEAADTALEQTRKALVGLLRHSRESGYGVNVVKLWKTGSVDYKAIPELRGVNLDRYRGKVREEVRVTVVK